MSMETWEYDRIIESAKALQAKNESLRQTLQSAKEGFGVVQKYTVPPLASKKKEYWAGEYWHTAERTYEESKAICAANDEAKAANSRLLKKITALIEGAGIKQSHRVLKSRRGWKTEDVTCEWYSLLQAAIPSPSHTTDWLEAEWKAIKAIRDEVAKKQQQDRERREKEFEDQRRHQIKTAALVVSAQELGLDPETATLDEMIEAVRAKDKYLDLAVAMSDTRCDWSEGFYRVHDALVRFKVESPKDAEIVSAVSDVANGDDSDGRVFRDMGEYCYDNLFAMADRRWRDVLDKLRSIGLLGR